VVGVGPGSFTGVRAAVVTARTIAQALTLPLIGVSILECYAYTHGVSTAVVLEAGRDLFFSAAYDIVPLAVNTDDKAQSHTEAVDLVCTRGPACVNGEAIFEMLKDSQRCLVDASCLPLLAAAGAQLDPLPHLNNIAVVQSELVFNRLSLSMAGSSRQSNKAFEESLLGAFPYESIQPLYLRSASVTLKGSR
jgi:tRNA threonylcarbamoyl adenosine modification protein YeaZ